MLGDSGLFMEGDEGVASTGWVGTAHLSPLWAAGTLAPARPRGQGEQHRAVLAASGPRMGLGRDSAPSGARDAVPKGTSGASLAHTPHPTLPALLARWF